jgi:serine/threonine protein kinase
MRPGTSLGPYEIVEPIGRGGMGEVYRARDTRLNRQVAIKISGARSGSRAWWRAWKPTSRQCARADYSGLP